MARQVTKMAGAAIGVACLLWSLALAWDAMPPGAVRRTAASTDQPDFATYERKVEGLRRGLAALDRIEGQYTAGDHSATYVAFVDGALPIVVAEQWSLGEYGGGEAVFHTSCTAICCVIAIARAACRTPARRRMAGTSAR
jgi:hypothetical protein